MSSASLAWWRGPGSVALDQMELAHRAVGGPARGRRYATQQLNHGYLLLLSSHFQRFCRDLHSEAVDHLLQALQPSPMIAIIQRDLTRGRKLDSGNPNPGNLGSDFGRLGLTSFWADVLADHRHNQSRKGRLEQMNAWRNAIAHQDFTSNAATLSHRTELGLAWVRWFRGACDGLAGSLDAVVLRHIKAVVGPTAGW